MKRLRIMEVRVHIAGGLSRIAAVVSLYFILKTPDINHDLISVFIKTAHFWCRFFCLDFGARRDVLESCAIIGMSWEFLFSVASR